MGPIFIRSATIYAEKEKLKNGALLIEDGKIAKVFTEDERIEVPSEAEIIDGTNLNVIPGFIDGHIHGANGYDAMDATEESLQGIAAVLPQEGTTSFLATTMTGPRESIEKALANVRDFQNQPGQAELLGVHLEGPFIEKKKAGAQPKSFIMEPDLGLFQKWQRLSGNCIKTVTMAPEHDVGGIFIKKLTQSGVNVSAGHTNIDFAGMKQAVAYGIRQVTHLFNAMSAMHHREIGAAGAAFLLKELRAELIADGIHVSPEMMQLTFDHLGSERLMLITDSMRAKGLDPGAYELGGQCVKVTEERAVLDDGTLAGSILKMNEGAKKMLDLEGVTLLDIIEMASVNPAKQIGVYDSKGSIAVGKDADLLLIDEELNIHTTICRGVISK